MEVACFCIQVPCENKLWSKKVTTLIFLQPMGGPLGNKKSSYPRGKSFVGDTVMALHWEINFSHSASHQWPESPESSTRCPEYFGMQVCRKLQRGGSERKSLASNFRDVGLHLHMSTTALFSKNHGGKWDGLCLFYHSKDWAVCFSMSSLNAVWSAVFISSMDYSFFP